MVTAAGIVVILSLLFQPLAGSLFQIRIISEHMDSRGLVTGILEYNPDALARPTPFLASAGVRDDIHMYFCYVVGLT